MENTTCRYNCLFDSLRQLMGEHLPIILAAGVFGAVIGFVAGGTVGIPLGGGVGMLLAVVYGYIPRLTDCAGTCGGR
jgi:uncharacterized protein YcfJ